MAELTLEIFTPAKPSYSGNIKSVSVPGTLGAFQVLFNHAPIISTLEIGVIKVEPAGVNNEKILFFAIGGGTIEVLNNKVKILVDSLEAVEDIDIDRARNALARAEERISKKSIEKIDVIRAEAALARAKNRISASEKYLSFSK